MIVRDVLGEIETGILIAALTGFPRPDELPALGWGGDQYSVISTADGAALVWFLVFDDGAAANAFDRRVGSRLRDTIRPGYRAELQGITLDGHPAIRYTLAPASAALWTALPAATIKPPDRPQGLVTLER